MNLPTGTVTFLFSDIEGSTKLWEAHPDTMRVALARHDALMRDAIFAHSGILVKTTGDGFLAAFPTAPGALAATISAQQSLRQEPWPEHTPIKARMGLHTGIAELRDGDYYGTTLNRAARLMAAGFGGQILLSMPTYELVRDMLPDGVTLRDLGTHRLRDLARPEHIFQAVHSDLPADFPPLKSLDNTALPNNLPRQITSFVGREKEMAEAKRLLARTNLLTLTGSGGSGKTRLSLQIAADVLEDFPDGVWFVELAPLTDPTLIPQTVVTTIGLKEGTSPSLQQSLIDHLRTQHLLLVLDNCEHLLSGCASLAASVLRNCSHVKILASSRSAMGIAGEQTYRVPSLSLPAARQSYTPETLTHYEAVRLFVDRALLVKPDFQVTNKNAPALASLCLRLDGIPLAIELAAARLRSLSVEDINDKLNNLFRLLTGGDRSALPRQQTLRALIDWSYDLLSDSEKMLLARLSVFVGGWDLEAAEAVCADTGVRAGVRHEVLGVREDSEGISGRTPNTQDPTPASPIEDWEVMDLLSSLVDKSLVLAETGSGSARYRLLETVRQYAQDRLEETGERARIQGRHARYYLELAETAESFLIGASQHLWFARLEAEHDNLRAALNWFVEQRDGPESELRLAGSLWRFWSVRGHFSEGRQNLRNALARSEAMAKTERRAKALNGAGILAQSQGDFAEAVRLHEESLAIHRSLGNRQGMATSLNNRGIVAWYEGKYEQARELFEECLTIKREAQDALGIAVSLGNLGLLANDAGDYGRAWRLHEESLTILRELGDKRAVAGALNNLGQVRYNEGDYEQARALYEESLEIKRELGDSQGIALSLGNLGLLASDRGDYATARSLYEESLMMHRQLGDQPGVARALNNLADVVLASGNLTDTVRIWAFVDTWREVLRAPLPPDEQEGYERAMNQVREKLGDEVFGINWQEGRILTLEQAIELALLHNTADGTAEA